MKWDETRSHQSLKLEASLSLSLSLSLSMFNSFLHTLYIYVSLKHHKLLFQALTVFILYVRSTRINPADPGIMDKFGVDHAPKSPNINLPGNCGNLETGNRSSPISTCRSSQGGRSSTKDSTRIARIEVSSESTRKQSHFLCYIGAFFYLLFVKDDCRKQEDASGQHMAGEDALFCTLCNTEVDFFLFNTFEKKSLLPGS